MKLISLFLVSVAMFAGGCGTLIPKKVEFFQDKVRKFPEAKASEKETQRQAASLAAKTANETLVAAVSNNDPISVIAPAKDTVVLTEAVATSLGPPVSPVTPTDSQGVRTAPKLAAKLDTATAKLDTRVEDFKKDNNENAGKKIEDTGLFKIPYLVWLGVCGVLVFALIIFLSLVWAAVKLYATTNPPLALGLNAAQLAGKTVQKGLLQMIKGGENFKDAVQKKFGNTDVANDVLALFRTEHQKAQDEEIKRTVEHLTK